LLSQISIEAKRRVQWVGLVVVFILVVRNISHCFEGVNKKIDVGEILVLWCTKHLDDTLEVVPIECAWWWQGCDGIVGYKRHWVKVSSGKVGIRGKPRSDRSG
jgi:hypothetical protein